MEFNSGFKGLSQSESSDQAGRKKWML